MARITGLAPDPRRPGVVRVLVDGHPFCAVPADAAVTAGLEVGAPWSGELAAVTGRFADEAAVWQSLLVALARRAFSVEELRRRLTRKGHHPEVVAKAIVRARGERLLDDAAFAEQYVASRAARGRHDRLASAGPIRPRLTSRRGVSRIAPRGGARPFGGRRSRSGDGRLRPPIRWDIRCRHTGDRDAQSGDGDSR